MSLEKTSLIEKNLDVKGFDRDIEGSGDIFLLLDL